MDFHDNKSSLPNSSSNLYGRSLEKDYESFYKDLDIRNALAVFGRYSTIQTATQLADILKIDLNDASNRLDCLQNLGLIKMTSNGYVETKSNSHYIEPKTNDSELRKKQQAEKLIQIAGYYPNADKISDLHGVYCSSEDSIKQFKSDILNAVKSFEERNSKLKPSEKSKIINFILGYTENEIFNDNSEGL